MNMPTAQTCILTMLGAILTAGAAWNLYLIFKENNKNSHL